MPSRAMSIWLGVGFALCSTVASSAAYVLQKIAHNRYDADHPVPEGVKVGNGDAAGQPESVKEGPPTPPATPETQKPASVGVVGTRPNSPVPIPRAETASPSGERVSRSPDAVTIAVEAADASEAHSPAPDMPVLPHPEGKRSYTRYWQFPAGLALLVIGTIFAAAVFGLAPQVRPLVLVLRVSACVLPRGCACVSSVRGSLGHLVLPMRCQRPLRLAGCLYAPVCMRTNCGLCVIVCSRRWPRWAL